MDIIFSFWSPFNAVLRIRIRKDPYNFPGSRIRDPFPGVVGSRIRDPFPGVVGSGSRSVSYSNEHNKINWKGKLTKYNMPSGWVLLDLLTRKIKLICIKSSTVLGTLPLWYGKDPDLYLTVRSGSVSNWKAGSGSVSKGSGYATLLHPWI